jgi:hypothetical protein
MPVAARIQAPQLRQVRVCRPRSQLRRTGREPGD